MHTCMCFIYNPEQSRFIHATCLVCTQKQTFTIRQQNVDTGLGKKSSLSDVYSGKSGCGLMVDTRDNGNNILKLV